MSDLFNVRKAAVEDLPFIFNSWLKCYRAAPAVKMIPNSTYYASQHALIEKILLTSEVHIACNIEDPSQIYGYVVGKTREGKCTVHWLYCKHTFRRNGVAKALLQQLGEGPFEYSHRLDNTERLIKRPNCVYNPYFFLETK